MVEVGNERFFPASEDDIFAALQATAHMLFKVRHVDPHTRTVSFGTPMTGFSWGANMLAQVVPARGGAAVRVGGSSKMTTNFTAGPAERKHIEKLLAGMATALQGSEAVPALPPPGWFPDPQQPGRQRYWDGARWTGHYWPEPDDVLSQPEPRTPQPAASASPEVRPDFTPRPRDSGVGEPSLALMLEQLTLEAARHPLDEQVEVAGEVPPKPWRHRL